MSAPLKLDPPAQKALGSLDPQQTWNLLVSQALSALELDPEECQQEADKLNLLNQPDDPQELSDISDLEEVLVGMNPVLGLNLFLDRNPNFNLKQINQQQPLALYRKLLPILKSDRYLMTSGD